MSQWKVDQSMRIPLWQRNHHDSRSFRALLAAIAVMLLVFVAGASAQSQALPSDLAKVPEAVKNLPWKTIDAATVTPLEYDRALLIINHLLDELAPIRASEADLMSAYIEQQNLGAELAKSAPPTAAPPLTFPDDVKIAVAMLRG